MISLLTRPSRIRPNVVLARMAPAVPTIPTTATKTPIIMRSTETERNTLESSEITKYCWPFTCDKITIHGHV